MLRLARSDKLSIDLHDFDTAAATGRAEDAIKLYRGDFLHGVVLDESAFDLWADHERDRRRAQFRGLLEQAISACQAAGRWSEAIAHSRRLLDVAPLDENAARVAASTLLSAGRRTEARDVLAQFAARLHAELGLPAPPEIQSLLGRLERMGDAKTTPAAPSSAPVAQLTFAGREAELSQLLALWRTTDDDAGTLALIEGDAGIGKSRLVHELIVHAQSLRRATVLSARERASSGQVPFALFAEALRPLVRASGIVGASRHLLAEASRLLPELRDSLDLPPIASIDDEAARIRFFEGVAALVDAAAYEHPLLIALDDLQYLGPSSLDLLSYLAGRLAGSAAMFVLTIRPADTPAPVLARLRAIAAGRGGPEAQAPRSLVVVLPPLDRAAAAMAIEAACGTARLRDSVVSRILDRAAGVPGRFAELLRRASAGEDVAQLPVSVRSLAEERLSRLSSSQRRAFLVLGLLGRPVALATLADASHLSEAAARETAHVLESEGLIAFEGEHAAADAFAADVALETAGKASRAFLAGWIADALASNPASPPAELARFFALAGRGRDAFASARQAAFAALRLGAWPEAVQQLQAARSFAATTERIAEMEGLLSALGAGNLRIAADTARDTARTTADDARPTPPAAVGATVWERWFPNWRLLLGGAVATLIVSALVMARAPERAAARPLAADTLVVTEGDPPRAIRYVTGDLLAGFEVSGALERRASAPAWADSVGRPWTNAMPGPRGQLVSLEHVSGGGSDVYVVTADRRDTVALTRGEGDARALGWSPDGRWLLVITTARGSDGVSDADLIAIRSDGLARTPIDTAANRSVVEAAWSPDGSRIAWVARVGAERQQEVFVSLADGSAPENITRHPADDYHIAWSGDGELLGFTSLRDGNAELYALTMRERRLWRLTRDDAQDDWARFSASGRLVAFESTRGGTAGVYVMAALGGEPSPIGEGLSLAVREWLGGRRRFVEHLRVEMARAPEPGDTAELRVVAFDQYGEQIGATLVGIRPVDSTLAVVLRDDETGAHRIVGRRPGLARLVVDVGRWRFDTAAIRIGSAPLVILQGVPASAQWRALGQPVPVFGPDGARLGADREWESGILARSIAPLLPELTLTAEFTGGGGLDSTMISSSSVSVALVAPEQVAALDTVAPQFLRHASFTWDADTRRAVYAAGREVFSQQAAFPAGAAPMRVELRVETDSTVSFIVNGTLRWKSTLRVITTRSDPHVQAWIGGRSTGSLRVSAARVALAGAGIVSQ